jgi:uncharacterized protein YlzI (FlbEa/FlbD family)
VKTFIEELKEINSKIKVIEKTIGHEVSLITELERTRAELEKTKHEDVREVLNRIEENKRRVRDLEYEGQTFKHRKQDLETQYRQERIGRLTESLKVLVEKRDRVRNELIPRMEEKITNLRNKIVEMDTQILRLQGKIQFLSEK